LGNAEKRCCKRLSPLKLKRGADFGGKVATRHADFDGDQHPAPEQSHPGHGSSASFCGSVRSASLRLRFTKEEVALALISLLVVYFYVRHKRLKLSRLKFYGGGRSLEYLPAS
jgi:hypothetical protein